eukprot:gb/GFBE01044830.1/.p1 GENE.gb/GFBE01044830.1/~~gb/GFBE01044830.1/.p1  ORF type:complete len:1240 (+),score=339.42 gb/GFBE01044830.1/:1-3720(+)
MGCGDSKGAAFKTRLDQVQASVANKPWRDRGDLRQIEWAVNELEQIHGWFHSEGKDLAELARIQRLADLITEELTSLMDVRLIKSDTAAVQTLIRAAKQLDNFRATRASDMVLQKRKGCISQIVKESLSAVNSYLPLVNSPQTLKETVGKVLGHLKQAAPSMGEAPDNVPAMLHQCSSLGSKILDFIPALMDVKPRDADDVERLALSLDDVAENLSRSHGHSWENVGPQIKQIRAEASTNLVAEKLDLLEAALKPELAGDCTNIGSAVKLSSDICALWIAPDEAQKARLGGLMDRIAANIQSAFDESIALGDTGSMTTLLSFAKDLDDQRKQMRGADAPAISKDLERKKAGVTLNALIGNAENNVKKQSEALHTLFQEAEAKVLKAERDSLKTIAEGARWKFKLGSGGFKDFSEEKSAEVERLYQDWCSKGKPVQPSDRRYEISIPVRGGTTRPSLASADGSHLLRKRCSYGDKCYRKNPEHKRDFCHPGDPDWEAEDNPGKAAPEVPVDSEEIRQERYSMDFLLMTQVNLSKGGRGMRNINRVEGMTVAQKLTHEHFGKVIEFVKEAENTFTQAEMELHILGEAERATMEKQVDSLTNAMRPALKEFLQLAVLVNDRKVIDEVMALLGVHAERLRLTDELKEIRLSDVLGELTQAYARSPARAAPRGWNLLKQLCKRQMLNCRLGLVKTKREHAKIFRRHVEMRCQALLSEYEHDKDFGAKFRRESTQILLAALRDAASRLETEVVIGILKTAASWQCDMDQLLVPAGQLVVDLTGSACKANLQPLSRVTEVLSEGDAMAKAAQRPVGSFYDLNTVLPVMAEKCFEVVQKDYMQAALQADPDASRMPSFVKQVLDVRSKLQPVEVAEGFDAKLWKRFEPWYRRLQGEGASQKQTAASEWAIAYCEQLKIPVPKWMMDKDQVEALRKLQAAVDTGDEKALREAVVFAKLTDCKTDTALLQKYDEALARLRHLKRLPSGWEVTDLVGDDASAKMFKKADLEDPKLKELFQKLFDDTKASIVTRDRATRGDGVMPRGYRVEKIISVMNAESWGAYMKRVDEISEQCRRFSGAAPTADSVWAEWSGKVHTAAHGEAILQGAHLPGLAADANEFLMFHGTKPEAADSIAKNHFDMAFACKTGLFGAGLYFAESSSKSDEYVKGDAKGWYPMILCRVTLGRINYCSNKDPVTDPGRDKLESSCIGGEFHSVLGDRMKARGTYREFVVYDHYQVYPHFIVWYSRI